MSLNTKRKGLSPEEEITQKLVSVARLVHKYYTNQRGIRKHNLLNPENLAQINITFDNIKSEIDSIPDDDSKRQIMNNYDKKWKLYFFFDL